MSEDRLDKQAKIEIKHREKIDAVEEDLKIKKQLRKEYWLEVRHMSKVKTQEYIWYAIGGSLVSVPVFRSVAIFPIIMTGYLGLSIGKALWSVPKPTGI